jgi:hypothetical protein
VLGGPGTKAKWQCQFEDKLSSTCCTISFCFKRANQNGKTNEVMVMLGCDVTFNITDKYYEIVKKISCWKPLLDWLLAAGCWLLAAGCWLLAAGCWLVVGGWWWLVVGGGWWLVVGGWWLVGDGSWAVGGGW